MANQNIFNPQTGQYGYQVPGATLPTGWQATGGQSNPALPATDTPAHTDSPISPEDQKLLSLGITPDQLSKLNTPAGLDPASFQGLIGNVEQKLKTNNDLVTSRGYLMKHLYDSPLTPDELSKLPPDLQKVVGTGDKNTTELQLRLLNDQIAGRGNTLSQSIQYLTQGYKDSETQKQTAFNNLISIAEKFVNPSTGRVDLAKMEDSFKAMYPGVDMSGIIKQLQGMMPISEYNKGFYQGVNTSGSGGVGHYDLSSYASDPNYTNTISQIIGNVGPVSSAADAQNYISKIMPTSPISGAMVMNAAAKYGVDPAVMLAQLQQESQMGTSNVATQNNNPTGITWSQTYQNSHPGVSKGSARPEGGNYVKFPSLQDGINANAEWLGNHPSLTDVQSIAKAVESGLQPPDLKSLYGKSGPVKAQLGRDGFDLSKATLQWNAANKWITALNSSQMARFKTLGVSVVNTIDEVTRLADVLKNGGVPVMNLANMATWVQTNNNSPHAQDIIQYLTAANTLKEEFANLAQGGYAPTEASWGLANKQINENYGNDGLKSSLNEVQRLINYRLNAPSETTSTIPGGGDNPYLGGNGASPVNSTSVFDNLFKQYGGQ